MEFNLFPKDMWVGATKNCWAVDGAERNGKHYFFYIGKLEYRLAVSTDGPGGPYKDTLGKSIGKSYDPVFIDDDENKTPYLITFLPTAHPPAGGQLPSDIAHIARAHKPTLQPKLCQRVQSS